MTRTIAMVIEDGREFGRVFYDEAWGAYGYRVEDFTNGPFDTAKDAALAMDDEELCGKGLDALLDRIVLTCERHDAEAT